MENKLIPLAHLKENKRGCIVMLKGGMGFQRKLRVMGIREGQTIKVVSRQPFKGPLTVTVCGCQMTLGRGMTHKIIVEEI